MIEHDSNAEVVHFEASAFVVFKLAIFALTKHKDALNLARFDLLDQAAKTLYNRSRIPD